MSACGRAGSLVVIALELLACSPGAEATEGPKTAPADQVEVAVAPPAAAAEPSVERPSAFSSATPASKPPPSPHAIGVPACDEYLQLLAGCYADPVVRDAIQPGLEATKKAWQDALESGEAGRAALQTACETALDAFPREACTATTTP